MSWFYHYVLRRHIYFIDSLVTKLTEISSVYTVNSLCSGQCRDLELASSLARVRNRRSLFQSIPFCRGFSYCPFQRDFRYSGVSSKRELVVYTLPNEHERLSCTWFQLVFALRSASLTFDMQANTTHSSFFRVTMDLTYSPQQIG